MISNPWRFRLMLAVAAFHLLAGCEATPPQLGSLGTNTGTGRGVITADAVPSTAPSQAAATPREDMMNPIVLQDALTNIDAYEKTLAWKPFRTGIEIARIYNTPDNGPAAAFLKYQPGASVALHMHAGYEHIFILKGSQVDRSGEHSAGSVVINPPGSSHTVTSPQGCIVLIIWDKPIIPAP